MNYIELGGIKQVKGNISLPGSKSISTRILILASLAKGSTVITGLLNSDDVQIVLQALTLLGIKCYPSNDGLSFIVIGSCGYISVKNVKLFLGNAGIAFRLLTAILALSNGCYDLSGTSRMHERPIGDLVDALRQIGADIRYMDKEGYPPISICPGNISISNDINVRGNVSSQFLTSLLIALPLAGSDAIIKVIGELVSKPYIMMTIQTMQNFGFTVTHDDTYSNFFLKNHVGYTSPGVIDIEGDASSASYFLAAGAIGGGPVRVDGVGRNSIQGDIAFAEILASMGAEMRMGDDWIEVENHTKLSSIDRDLNHIPDAAMTVAVTALFAAGTTTLRNIGTWRVKETDRLSAMAIELRKLGASVEEGEDYLQITPPITFTSNACIDTYGDHRMAMAFSLIAVGGVPVRINNPECVSKTYPDYFQQLAMITK